MIRRQTAHAPERTLWGSAGASPCHGGRCPPPEGGDRLNPGLSPGVVVAVGGCAQYVGPTGRAFAWSRGEGGDTSNPRLSRGGKPLSPGDTWSCCLMSLYVCLYVCRYVCLVWSQARSHLGLLGHPGGESRYGHPGRGAVRRGWPGRYAMACMHSRVLARARARA